jgi:WD40 repeat protein
MNILTNEIFSSSSWIVVRCSVLASCSTVSTDEVQHENVVLTASVSGTKLDALQHNKDWSRQGGATTSIAFGGKSRYLCLGDTSGAVCLWDLKKRLRVRQFSHDGYPSRQVALDPTDKLVLSLADQKFSIYNLREGTLSSTLTPQGDYSYTRFSTSALEPHIAALGTRDGSILLYDIARTATDNNKYRAGTKPFFSMHHRHSESISGIAISAANPQLVGTSSYDGTLKFFDFRSGETIHKVASLDSAITSLSLHAEGVSCAVGTTAGSVLVYDLRKMLPVASIAVTDSVVSLQYAFPPKPKASITTSPINPSPSPPAFVEHQRHQTPHQHLDTPPRQHDDTKMNHVAPQPRGINHQGIGKPSSPQKSLQTFATDNAQRGPTTRPSEEEKSSFPQVFQQRPPHQPEEKSAPALPTIEMVRRTAIRVLFPT